MMMWNRKRFKNDWGWSSIRFELVYSGILGRVFFRLLVESSAL